MATKHIDSISQPFTSIIRRFHLTIFFVFVTACLIGGVLMIDRMLTEGATSGDNYKSSIQAGSIDEATLQRIQSLHPSTEPDTGPSLPSGRVNPFGE